MSARADAETRREVAHIGWTILRGAIRDAERDLAEIDRTIRRGTKKVIRRGSGCEYADLTSQELAALALERTELAVWIAGLCRERRENGLTAGDLITEMDRAREGLL